MKPDLLVSDFGGTLLSDGGIVFNAYRQALDAFNIPFTDDDIRVRRGANKRAVFRELAARVEESGEAGSALAEQALATFEDALRNAYVTGAVTEIPGAERVVSALRDSGMKVALTTGFASSLVTLLLDRLGWTDLFDLVLSGDSVPMGRPAPFMIFQSMIALGVDDVRRVAVIGDTPLDLQAATRAGAGWIIGTLSGAHTIETLGRTPHTHIVPSIASLPGLFDL